jgi:ankyrin repeat protein
MKKSIFTLLVNLFCTLSFTSNGACSPPAKLDSEIHLAVSNGDIKKVKQLLEHDLSNLEKKQSYAHWTHCDEHWDILDKRWLRIFGFKIIDESCFFESDETPLITAIYKNQYNIARLLLEKGANPNAQEKKLNVKVPLIEAIRYGSKITDLLISYKADIKIKGRCYYGKSLYEDIICTPLHQASVENKLKIIKKLVQVDSQALLLKDSLNDTPCQTAKRLKKLKALEYFQSLRKNNGC